MTKDLIDNRLELRWSTKSGSLQRKGKTALLEMSASHLLPCCSAFHRWVTARKTKAHKCQNRLMDSGGLLRYATEASSLLLQALKLPRRSGILAHLCSPQREHRRRERPDPASQLRLSTMAVGGFGRGGEGKRKYALELIRLRSPKITLAGSSQNLFSKQASFLVSKIDQQTYIYTYAFAFSTNFTYLYSIYALRLRACV
jgi:hypothetical protein